MLACARCQPRYAPRLAWMAALLAATRVAPAQEPALNEPAPKQEPSRAEPVEVSVHAQRRAPAPTELKLSGARAAEGAGTQGDPLKALQSLPGLGRGGAGGGDFVAWGSEPRQSRIELDGVELPSLYHGSGVRSVVQPGLVESLTVVPGAFGAAQGRALGGLVSVETRPLELAAPRFSASADFLDASALASVPLAEGRSAALGAVRYGYVDRWLPRLIEPELRGLYAVPSYWDAHAELETALRSGESARLVALASFDRSATQAFVEDPSRALRAEQGASFGRVYLRYQRVTADQQELQLTPFVGWDASELSEARAGRSSELRVRALRYGLRAEHRARLSEPLSLVLGLDASGTSAAVTRQGSPSVPRREGDPYPFGTPPGAGFARDEFRAHALGVGAYAELELRLGVLRLAPALRCEPTVLEASRKLPRLGGLPDIGTSRLELLLEPRISAEARLSPAVRLFVAGGLYHQPPEPAELGARFGNPELGEASATHLSFGESVSLASRTRVELTVFSKWLSGLAARAPSATPRLGEALVANGRGRAFGTQLFLRQAEVAGFSGWLSATLSRSEREDPGGAPRLSDFDAPLVMALVVQKVLGAWRFGARARFASGLPRTPVTGAFYDLTSNGFQPELGPTNSSRLRDFAQLDLRFDRSFRLGESARLELYLDLLNVTARNNQEELLYASDFRTRAGVSGLPALAVLGVKVER